MLSKRFLTGLMAICLMVVVAQASIYMQDFNSAADGSTNLGDGSTIVGSRPGVTQVFYNGGSWRALRLTQDGYGGTVANYVMPDLGPGNVITKFTATFDMLIQSESGDAADGVSFNFGALGTLPYGGEDGMYNSGAGPMLSVCWRTFDNPRSIKVLVNGSTVASETTYPPIVADSIDDLFQSVTINLDSNGLDLSYAGTTIFTDLDVAGFTPSAGDLFAFAARTGGLNEDVFIDNLSITTVPEPVTLGLLGLGGVTLVIRKRR